VTVKRKIKRGLGLKGLKPYYIIIGIIIFLLVVTLILLKSSGGNELPEGISAIPVMPEEITEKPASTVNEKPGITNIKPAAVPEIPETKEMGSLSFVIDDVGNNVEQLKYFLHIPFPVTFAIMPDRDHSAESAKMITEAGHHYILHQPMEALSGADPGASAIMTGMSRVEIQRILEHNFRQLPDAAGMNNHMGSKATSDPEVMDAVMEYLSKNNLFFLDSYTISNSLGVETAEKYDVRYLKRNSMFLDNEKDHESIQNAIHEGTKTAGKKGHAVMIGHIMTGELADTMLELYPNFIEDGFSIREISEIFIEMSKPAGDEE
jgi:hypothetical protein